MATTFEVRLPAGIPGAADLACRALDAIEDVESLLTVYRADSPVSRLNETAHEGLVRVDPRLFSLVELAVEIGRKTAGAYDLTAGALSIAWGFTRGPRRVPDADSLARARDRTGASHLLLDRDGRTIGFDRPGIVLNFGSLGKGYALDEAAAILRDHWFPTSALIHGGRSSVFALGSPAIGTRWEVALRNPIDPDRPLGTFRLRNRGLGTSGAAFQQFEEGGRLYGHILDPRTGEPPADGPWSVSVVAPTAAQADAFSTAFYLLGPARTREVLAGLPEVGAVFALKGADPGGPPRIVGLNVSPGEFRPSDSLDPSAVFTTLRPG